MMNQESLIHRIAQAIHDAGGRALLVGGCVRDALLGKDCYDVDCEVHGMEPDALRALLETFGEIDESGKAYGIFTLRHAGLDFALPRRETRTGPGHKDFAVTVDPYLLPEQAAARRDFTVNAIMRDALTGEYVDPFGGIGELKSGVLRAVPGGQFEEDALRVLRGAQFAARFDLVPDVDTLQKLRRMNTEHLSGARVCAEMKKALLMAERPDVFFRILEQTGALEIWFPELAALRRTPENPQYHPEGDAFEHTMLTLNAAAEIRNQMSDPLLFMLAALTHDLGKAVSARKNEKGVWQAIGHEHTGIPLCAQMLSRLGVSRQAIAYAQNMCALHMRVHTCYYGRARVSRTNLLFDESDAPQELAWLVVCDSRGTGKPRAQADEEQAFIMERLERYKETAAQPMPHAAQLMALGVAPGPRLKEAIAYARRSVLCGDEPQRAAQKAAKRYA